jgi:hypothetical protein
MNPATPKKTFNKRLQSSNLSPAALAWIFEGVGFPLVVEIALVTRVTGVVRTDACGAVDTPAEMDED